MHALTFAIRILCIIPFGTGVADMVNGVGLLEAAGARLNAVAHDPVLNSQVGFWGAIWLGFGVILWQTSSDLIGQADRFRLLSGILVLSGVARLGAAVIYGSPGPVLLVAMAVELLGGTGLLLWHRAILRASSSDPRLA